MTSAYAPFSLSYTNADPYLTTTEYINAPTAMDTANLLPNGDAEAQLSALAETINRASSEMDRFCCGAYGTLNATVNTENARIWGNRAGEFVVHPKYWPILEVQTFSYASSAGGTTASVSPAGNVWIEPQQFIVSQSGGVVGLGLNFGGWRTNAPTFCEWTYVNGWPNTLLSASVAVGASSLTLNDVTGIYPGTALSIYDVPFDESILVSPTYVPGSATVTLAAPTAYAHPAGVAVTNLPSAVKQAAILVTTSLIKQRGSGALIAADVGDVRPSPRNTIGQGGDADLDRAKELLTPFRTTYVGY